MQLEGKVVLVTGGTRGIGAATALALAAQGMDVALAARRDDATAQATRAAIEQLGRRCVMLVTDCARPEDNRRAVEQTAAQLGSLDVLIHAAGGPVLGGLLEVTPEAWHHGFDVHVHAIYHLCRAAVPLMRPKGEGAIILVSSVAALRGVPGILGYQTIKGAVLQMTRALARDLAEDHIRVNGIAPGVIDTEFHVLTGMTPEQRQRNVEARIPLHRHGKPEEIASMVVELVRNDYLCGETVTVDGGLTMRIA